jgi:thiol-disulfide isomerase/thioredoxin
MRLFRSLVLYTALALGANAAFADIASLEALREGSMKKLNFHSVAKAVPTTGFITFEGEERHLAEYQGQYVLLNFWATWCAPCRKEMPQLSALQAEFGGENFQVVTIATGRNPPPAMKKFFGDIGVSNLPLHRDPKQQLARQMGVFGLPGIILLNPEGEEIGRLTGPAEWDSDSARAIVATLIAGVALD